MALRQIILYDNPILRKKCKKVDVIDNKIKEILEDMAETMYHSKIGAGLAACQVGILKRLVVIDMGDGLIKLINPEIIESEGLQKVTEGCLSFPNRWGELTRPSKVKVQYWNENGERMILKAENDFAKCICHEIDHLEGVLFIDKVTKYV